MRTFVSILLATALAALATPAEAETRLLRFPDIHGDRVVFTYAGDLWLAAVTGGTAVRLTSHPGRELFARFSPDGSQIAVSPIPCALPGSAHGSPAAIGRASAIGN